MIGRVDKVLRFMRFAQGCSVTVKETSDSSMLSMGDSGCGVRCFTWAKCSVPFSAQDIFACVVIVSRLGSTDLDPFVDAGQDQKSRTCQLIVGGQG